MYQDGAATAESQGPKHIPMQAEHDDPGDYSQPDGRQIRRLAAIVGRLIPATSIDPTSAKATRKPNQTARFMITPTTAAVMPESAADKCKLSRKRSI